MDLVLSSVAGKLSRLGIQLQTIHEPEMYLLYLQHGQAARVPK